MEVEKPLSVLINHFILPVTNSTLIAFIDA